MVTGEKVKKLNILGEEYSVLTYDNENFPKQGYDGLCNTLKKEICLREKNDSRIQKEVLRHEIIHAFLHESGLTEYENDELLVEWIAMQFPKLKTVIEKGESYLKIGEPIEI